MIAFLARLVYPVIFLLTLLFSLVSLYSGKRRKFRITYLPIYHTTTVPLSPRSLALLHVVGPEFGVLLHLASNFAYSACRWFGLGGFRILGCHAGLVQNSGDGHEWLGWPSGSLFRNTDLRNVEMVLCVFDK